MANAVLGPVRHFDAGTVGPLASPGSPGATRCHRAPSSVEVHCVASLLPLSSVTAMSARVGRGAGEGEGVADGQRRECERL
ncbi:MAG: hypothetical protein ACYC1D_18625, partial [Acidimicrobiales bacterium]